MIAFTSGSQRGAVFLPALREFGMGMRVGTVLTPLGATGIGRSAAQDANHPALHRTVPRKENCPMPNVLLTLLVVKAQTSALHVVPHPAQPLTVFSVQHTPLRFHPLLLSSM